MRTVLVAGALLVQMSWVSPQQAIYRARTDAVTIDVAVLDRRKPVAGLTTQDFVLRDNGVTQTVLDFNRERQPLDVTLTIDVSGSLGPKQRAALDHAAERISKLLEPADRVEVVTFSDHVIERMPLQTPPVVIQADRSGGLTVVFDAVLLSLVTAPQPGRRQLNVFMTDGGDTASAFDAKAIRDTARYSSTQMSFVLTRTAFAGGPNFQNARSALRAVAETTGGEVVELDENGDLSEAFLTTIDGFRTSYVLRYVPAGVSASGWHDVGVAVKGKPYTVRARRGYWVAGK